LGTFLRHTLYTFNAAIKIHKKILKIFDET